VPKKIFDGVTLGVDAIADEVRKLFRCNQSLTWRSLVAGKNFRSQFDPKKQQPPRVVVLDAAASGIGAGDLRSESDRLAVCHGDRLVCSLAVTVSYCSSLSRVAAKTRSLFFFSG